MGNLLLLGDDGRSKLWKISQANSGQRLVWDLSHDGIRQSAGTTSDPSEKFLITLKGNSGWIDLQYRMIGCCTRIWAAVKDVLCNDSPEGHLPHDLDEIDMLDTKDVLSYSFRAIHESR
jgi:hypothetical protein